MNLNKSKNSSFWLWIAGVFTFIQFNSCYSPVDGCLDPEATNYSINADNPCDDCCNFPVLDVSIFHENMDTTFRLNDTITNDLDQKISLLDYVYLLSDFKVYIGEEVYNVIDSVSLDVESGTALGKDDIIRVDRDNFTYEIGTIIFDGNTDSMSFRIGLNDLLNENPFTSEISNHPLTNDPDSLYQEVTDTYVFQRIKVAQGADFLDTVIYDISTAYETVFTLNETSVRGEDKTFVIAAQYNKWFDGIDFETMSHSEIEERIGENSVKLFDQKN